MLSRLAGILTKQQFHWGKFSYITTVGKFEYNRAGKTGNLHLAGDEAGNKRVA